MVVVIVVVVVVVVFAVVGNIVTVGAVVDRLRGTEACTIACT